MIKIVVSCILAGILILYLLRINTEMAMMASLVVGILILTYSLNYFTEIIDFFNDLIEKSGINKEIYIIIFKILAIGYLVEFGAGLLSDFGLNSLSDKLIFLGKILILSTALPILYSVFNLIYGLI